MVPTDSRAVVKALAPLDPAQLSSGAGLMASPAWRPP